MYYIFQLFFLFLDEDNESLFGAWFEEVLTLGDQQIDNVSSKTQSSDYVDLDKSLLDPSNYKVVPETDDPEGVIFIFVLYYYLIIFIMLLILFSIWHW